MSLKNAFILFLLKILRRVAPIHAKDLRRRHELLIVSTTALGDTLWATPAIRLLRMQFPKAQISVLTSPIGKEVLASNTDIDELFILKKPLLLSLAQNYLRLRKKKIDSIYIFHTSQRAVLPLCYLLGPRNIIGSPGINKGLDVLLTKTISSAYEHEIQRRLRIVSCSTSIESNTSLKLSLPIIDKTAGLAFLHKHNLNAKPLLIGMHPGSKDKFKQWSPDCFIALGKLLQKELDCAILITGGSYEQILIRSIAAAIPGSIALDQTVALDTLATVIEQCDLFITNDTGPMHVALAVGTKTLALFTSTDPQLCGPWNSPQGHIIQRSITCSPCIKKKCRLPFCMLQISPEQVKTKALQILQEPQSCSLLKSTILS